jgi:hypothetical protein
MDLFSVGSSFKAFYDREARYDEAFGTETGNVECLLAVGASGDS